MATPARTCQPLLGHQKFNPVEIEVSRSPESFPLRRLLPTNSKEGEITKGWLGRDAAKPPLGVP